MDKSYSNKLLCNNILWDNENVSNDIASWQQAENNRKRITRTPQNYV